MSATITTLINKEVDAKAKTFGKYEEAKARIIVDIKIASTDKKRKKMIEDLEEKLGRKDKGK